MSSIRAVIVVSNKRRLDEFESLVREAGYTIVGRMYVKRFTSKGLSDVKIEELKNLVSRTLAEYVLFDTELKPKHMYNIWKGVGTQVKDRVEIILEIFKKHSPSKEADLQIKLASLNYELARAREKVLLAKAGEQPALIMGPGQYEVDKYYLEVKRRIQTIKRKLEEERRRREIHRSMRKRRGYKTIAIAGYTCSGKTTLFNRLSNLDMKVGDEPFTTLSTKYFMLRLGPWRAYFIDTIGFIEDLPPFMIKAFYSTLEEIKEADIVYLVIDVTEYPHQILKKLETSLDILNKLEYSGNIILVGNKIDLINNLESLRPVESIFKEHGYPYVFISAEKGVGIDKLLDTTLDLLGRGVRIKVEVPFTHPNFYKVLDMLKESGTGKIKMDGSGAVYLGWVSRDTLMKLRGVRGIRIEEGISLETRS